MHSKCLPSAHTQEEPDSHALTQVCQ